MADARLSTDLVVIGGGPAGYNAAFRAADLGLKTLLVDSDPESRLGGTCLNAGCIPSKALLHVSYILEETKSFSQLGIKFLRPDIEFSQLRKWQAEMIGNLAKGLKSLALQRKITVLNAFCKFLDSHTLVALDRDGNQTTITFAKALIATGSRPINLNSLPSFDSRIMDSTSALKLPLGNPLRLLIIGGGTIGLEMATIYHQLGSQITIIETAGQLSPHLDADLVRPIAEKFKKENIKIFVGSKIIDCNNTAQELCLTIKDSAETVHNLLADAILVAVGREPNSRSLDLAKAGVKTDERGFIEVNKFLQTSADHIYAAGDVIGGPMLAHKASYEGRLAAENIAEQNKKPHLKKHIPYITYTHPELATVGLTEKEARGKNVNFAKAVFPWIAAGRAHTLNQKSGFTKLLYDKDSKKILGAAIVGPNASELIAEVVLALEMNATISDIADSIHPHPTLSETIMHAAETGEKTVTDLFIPR